MLDPNGPMGKLVGSALGQSHIVEPLGQGGMATLSFEEASLSR